MANELELIPPPLEYAMSDFTKAVRKLYTPHYTYINCKKTNEEPGCGNKAGDNLNGSIVVLHLARAMKGFQCWIDKQVVDESLVPLLSVEEPEAPTSAGRAYNNKESWPGGDNPWSPLTFFVPMLHEESGDEWMYSTSSQGGRNAIGQVLFKSQIQMLQGFLPRVRLETSTYKHEKFGTILKPKFTIVGWAEGFLPKPEAKQVAYSSDSITSGASLIKKSEAELNDSLGF
jgi:hypothetical protein